MIRVALLAALAAFGCREAKPREREITGTLSIGGRDVASAMTCRPGAAVHIFVDIVTPEGTLRFEDQKLTLGGAPLACTKLDRSWGGGRRPGNVAYWRGTLAFECTGEAGRVVRGDLALDCGNITPAERAALDANRKTLRDEQAAGSGSGD